MRKRLLYFRKSVVLCQTKILVSMFSGKDNCVFWRNVTRCYAKNIIVQTFSVLLSHYYRITIALPSYTNARVIQAICLVGVNCYPVTFKISVLRVSKKGFKSVPLHSHSSAMDTQTRWGAMRTHWGGIGLYWEVQSIAIIVPIWILIRWLAKDHN